MNTITISDVVPNALVRLGNMLNSKYSACLDVDVCPYRVSEIH